MSDEPKKKIDWNSNVISALGGMLVALFVSLVAIGATKIDRAQAKDIISATMAPVLEFQKEAREHWASDSTWKENFMQKKFKIVTR